MILEIFPSRPGIISGCRKVFSPILEVFPPRQEYFEFTSKDFHPIPRTPRDTYGGGPREADNRLARKGGIALDCMEFNPEGAVQGDAPRIITWQSDLVWIFRRTPVPLLEILKRQFKSRSENSKRRSGARIPETRILAEKNGEPPGAAFEIRKRLFNLLVPAGGLDKDNVWRESRKRFLVRVNALSSSSRQDSRNGQNYPFTRGPENRYIQEITAIEVSSIEGGKRPPAP